MPVRPLVYLHTCRLYRNGVADRGSRIARSVPVKARDGCRLGDLRTPAKALPVVGQLGEPITVGHARGVSVDRTTGWGE